MEFRGYLTLDGRFSLEEAFAEYAFFEEMDEGKDYPTTPFLACYDGYVRYYVWFRVYVHEKYYMAAKRMHGESDRLLPKCNCFRCTLNVYNPLRSFLSPYTCDCLLIGELASKKRLQEVRDGKRSNVYAHLTEIILLFFILFLLW
jgi:hypothetical protein